MKDSCVLGKAVETQKFSCTAAIKCLLFMLAVLSVVNPAMLPPYGVEIDGSNKWPSPVEERKNFDEVNSGKEASDKIEDAGNIIESAESNTTQSPDPLNQGQVEVPSNTGRESSVVPISSEEKNQSENSSSVQEINALVIEEKVDSDNQNQAKLPEEWSQDKTTESSETKLNAEEMSETTEPESLHSENQEEIEPDEFASNQNRKSKLKCDFTHFRADTCTMEGDVRVLGTNSTIFVVSSTAQDFMESKLRPYARKWENKTMQMIRELNVKQALPNEAPNCTVRHDVPVVVFSTGGFVGNVFHDYTDILIPLFLATNQYTGNVKFAVTDMSWSWIFKYLPMIKVLSPYHILNLDEDHNVHCFPSAQVGLKSHKPLGIDPTEAPNGYTMQDFRAFIMKSFSLKRLSTTVVDLKSGRRPRLLIILRRATRAIVNEDELVAIAENIGFMVVTADPEKTRELPKFAHVVNSCDVMLGVHGAGLANMLYLPANATVIQILPWGNLGSMGRYDYGLPLPDMGLRYVEHEIKEDESTLIHKYPRDHAVFTDPQTIHDQGWATMHRIYLTEQNIMLNIDRFKGVLIDVFKSYVK